MISQFLKISKENLFKQLMTGGENMALMKINCQRWGYLNWLEILGINITYPVCDIPLNRPACISYAESIAGR
ncbi:MAG: hypothetical protein UX37_C0014G0011 [Microgenomates group bacterium GW2011_GWA2_46_16]|nr:MAG: hypothetical protein UX37_C0014G0011 [Microgenomates group bacterium GW2011_GWA2_46_16]